MSKVVFVEAHCPKDHTQEFALFQDGLIVYHRATHEFEDIPLLRNIGLRLAYIANTQMVSIKKTITDDDGISWDHIIYDLFQEGALGEFDLSRLDEWFELHHVPFDQQQKAPFTAKDYPEWLRDITQQERQRLEDRETEDAMVAIFGREAVDKLHKDEDPEAFDITLGFSALQRMSYFKEVSVPGSCTESQARDLADYLEPSIDGAQYEIDEEYWESGETHVEGV